MTLHARLAGVYFQCIAPEAQAQYHMAVWVLLWYMSVEVAIYSVLRTHQIST